MIWQEALRDPRPEMPSIDFKKYVVVVAAMGQQGSTGNSIDVVSIDSTGGSFNVHVTVTVTGRGCLSGGLITAPIDIVRVPRSRRPIVFVEKYKQTDCSK
ncbi:MAG TPA: protease complex subunit PrcB family protein [bacterium]|nr:protease complex subunit PrcB family protein [bacterium]